MAVKQGRIQYKTSSGTNEFRPRTDASVVEITPISGMSATDVQGALEELKASSGGGGLTVTQENFDGMTIDQGITVPITSNTVKAECWYSEEGQEPIDYVEIEADGPAYRVDIYNLARYIYIRYTISATGYAYEGLLEVFCSYDQNGEITTQKSFHVSTLGEYFDVLVNYENSPSSQSINAHAAWRVISQ